MEPPIHVAYTLLQCWHRVPGGTAACALAVARAMAERDDVNLVGVGPWGRSLPPAPWTPPQPLVRLPAPPPLVYDLWHHTRLLDPGRAVRGADVVHATATTVPARGKKPLVVTIHDLFPLQTRMLAEAAARHGVALEINSQIDRLDLNDSQARLARDRGVRIIISSDAHSPAALGVTRWGVTQARRAWLTPGDVLNTRPFETFRSLLRRNQR